MKKSTQERIKKHAFKLYNFLLSLNKPVIPITNKQLQEDLKFSEWNLRTAKNFLIHNGYITIKKEGIPAQNFYYINTKKGDPSNEK